MYLAVHEHRDGPFFVQPGGHQQSEYVYYSFVTLTTLGFGDLSPTVGLPQALTALEALLGQIFLVTLVARLVTLWVRQAERPRALLVSGGQDASRAVGRAPSQRQGGRRHERQAEEEPPGCRPAIA